MVRTAVVGVMRHTYRISPVQGRAWRWHLFGEEKSPPTTIREDSYDSHNLEASLKFGMVPDGYVPPILECVVHAGSAVTEELPRPNPPPPVPDGRWAGGLSGGVKDGYPPFPVPQFTTEAPYFAGPTAEPNLAAEEHFTGRVLDTRAVNPVTGRLVAYPAEVGIRDLSHLPTTPGEPGAPFLIRASKVFGQDTWVELQVSGWGAGAREYRYWSYNGLRDEVDDIECRRRFPSWRTGCEDGLKAEIEGKDFRIFLEESPSEFRVPFEELPSDGVVKVVAGLRGILSFQVRSLDPNVSDLPPNSNIEHQMVGMDGFHSIGPPWQPVRRPALPMNIPLPIIPPTDVPLPTLEVGSRPVRPAIRDVVQIPVVRLPGVPVERVPVEVEVTLSASYSGRVEYRWWPHSGFGPTAGFEVWCPAAVIGGSFRILDVEPKTPGVVWVPPQGPDEALWTPFRALLDFQVRLVNSHGPGDPSEAAVLMVWGGDYNSWSPYPLTPTPVVPVLAVPVPYTTPRAPDSC